MRVRMCGALLMVGDDGRRCGSRRPASREVSLKFLRWTRHVAPIVTLIAVMAAYALALAQSQPPSPSRGESKRQPDAQQTQPAQAQRAPVERGTEADPLV